MLGWLQAWANSKPITYAVDAARALALGGPPSAPLLRAGAWILCVLAVVNSLAVHRYRGVTQEPGIAGPHPSGALQPAGCRPAPASRGDRAGAVCRHRPCPAGRAEAARFWRARIMGTRLPAPAS